MSKEFYLYWEWRESIYQLYETSGFTMSNYFHSITYLESECLQSDINVPKIAHLFQKREKQNG